MKRTDHDYETDLVMFVLVLRLVVTRHEKIRIVALLVPFPDILVSCEECLLVKFTYVIKQHTSGIDTYATYVTNIQLAIHPDYSTRIYISCSDRIAYEPLRLHHCVDRGEL